MQHCALEERYSGIVGWKCWQRNYRQEGKIGSTVGDRCRKEKSLPFLGTRGLRLLPLLLQVGQWPCDSY